MSSAEAQGVGIRVINDQRVGFAYAGSLDEDVLAETLADARDNAGFGTRDEVRMPVDVTTALSPIEST